MMIIHLLQMTRQIFHHYTKNVLTQLLPNQNGQMNLLNNFPEGILICIKEEMRIQGKHTH